MLALKPGETIPKDGVIYGSAEIDAFRSLCMGYQEKIRKTLDDAIDGLKGEMTAAPEEEAVRTITLLQTRDKVGEDEISALLEKYGDNVQAHRAIADIAARQEPKVYVADSPVESQMRQMEDMRRSLLNAVNYQTAAQYGSGLPAFISFIDMRIDEVFPEG